jgi:hypothetical protein
MCLKLDFNCLNFMVLLREKVLVKASASRYTTNASVVYWRYCQIAGTS